MAIPDMPRTTAENRINTVQIPSLQPQKETNKKAKPHSKRTRHTNRIKNLKPISLQERKRGIPRPRPSAQAQEGKDRSLTLIFGLVRHLFPRRTEVEHEARSNTTVAYFFGKGMIVMGFFAFLYISPSY